MDNATLYIKTVLTLLANAEKYLDQFIIETKPKHQAKHFFNFELNKLKSISDDLILMAGPEHSKTIRDEITNNWETLSVQNVLGMMIQLTDEEKRLVEEYTEKILNKEI
jgi:hypothetical protein